MPYLGKVSLKSQIPSMGPIGRSRGSRLSRFSSPKKKKGDYHLGPSSGAELEERTLSWEPTGDAPKRTTGYYLELRRNQEEELLWAAACKEQESKIPEYVELKPGKYVWVLYPLNKEGIAGQGSEGAFRVY